MIHRRIAYVGALGAAVLFQIFFKGYFSSFLLVLVALTPVLSLALSLPGMLLCALELSPCASMVVRGEEARFQVLLHVGARLPLARVRLTVDCLNQMTGEKEALRRDLWGGGAAFSLAADARHCGRLVCSVRKAWVCDLLGLLCLPVRTCGTAALVVLPAPMDPDEPPDFAGEEQQGAALRPRPGGGPGEDYDLRSYRPGDPMKSVHWKLSTKRDELVVREVLEPVRAQLYLSYDHFGTPEDLDRTMDRLAALSRLLLERERPHCILWADPVSGELRERLVEAERGLIGALAEDFSFPAPLTGRSALEQTLPGGRNVRRIHVTPHGLEGGEAL